MNQEINFINNMLNFTFQFDLGADLQQRGNKVTEISIPNSRVGEVGEPLAVFPEVPKASHLFVRLQAIRTILQAISWVRSRKAYDTADDFREDVEDLWLRLLWRGILEYGNK